MLKELIPNLLPGDLIFTFDKGSILSWIIWKVTKKDVRNKDRISHVIIYLGEGLIADLLYYGLVIRNILVYDKQRFKVMACRPIGLENPEGVTMACKNLAGVEKYSIFQLVLFFFMKVLGKTKSFDSRKTASICSEFVSRLYRFYHVDFVPGINDEDISPLDLYNSNKLDILNA